MVALRTHRRSLAPSGPEAATKMVRLILFLVRNPGEIRYETTVLWWWGEEQKRRIHLEDEKRVVLKFER